MTLLSVGGYIIDTDYHAIYDINGNITNYNKPILIGSHVWIGMNCTILKGSIIPNDSIIAANSIVTKQLAESKCIYASNTLIKHNVIWKVDGTIL